MGNKKGRVILFSSCFHSSQKLWASDPSSGLLLALYPLLVSKGSLFSVSLIHFNFFIFGLILPLFLSLTVNLSLSISLFLWYFLILFLCPHVFVPLSPPFPLPLSLSLFLFSPSAMFCDWQLKLDCSRVNREYWGIPRGFTAEWRRTNKIITWE